MRAGALLALALLSCHEQPRFSCASSSQCGAGGVCLDAACAFADASCSSGYRWDVSAPGRARACVETPADMAMPAPLVDAASPPAPDLAQSPPVPDLAGSPCIPVACQPRDTCGGWMNPDFTQVAYLTCCTIETTLHCHDALGIGEACEKSICQPAATCANGTPNGSSLPIEMVCCKSDASALHCWTN